MNLKLWNQKGLSQNDSLSGMAADAAIPEAQNQAPTSD